MSGGTVIPRARLRSRKTLESGEQVAMMENDQTSIVITRDGKAGSAMSLRRHLLTLVSFLLLLVDGSAFAAEPAWVKDRSCRLLLRVDPLADLKRSSDEMVARVDLNFDSFLKDRRCNLESL